MKSASTFHHCRNVKKKDKIRGTIATDAYSGCPFWYIFQMKVISEYTSAVGKTIPKEVIEITSISGI